MPWKLRKAPKRPLYWVVDPNNKHYSKEPLPLARAKAQLKALYAAQSRGEMKGGGDVDFAKASYETSAPSSLDGYTLAVNTPTLKIYAKDGDYVVAVRGTYSSEDALADAALSVGALATTSRYKKDAEVLRRFREGHAGRYRGIGHSLGGAIIDQFLKDGLLDEGTSFNPAVSVGDFGADLKHKRIYKEGDPLYQLMGRHTKGAEVRKETKSLPRKLLSYIPYFGKLYDAYKSHQIEGFGLRGGNRLEDLETEARELQNQRDTLQNALDNEELDDEERAAFTEDIASINARIEDIIEETVAIRRREHFAPISRPQSRPPSRGSIQTVASNPVSRAPSPLRPPRLEIPRERFNSEVSDISHPPSDEDVPRPLRRPRTPRQIEVRSLAEARGLRDNPTPVEGSGKETLKTLATKNFYAKNLPEARGKLAIYRSELNEMEKLRTAPENQTAERQSLIREEMDATEDVVLRLTNWVLRAEQTLRRFPSEIKSALQGKGRHPTDDLDPEVFLKKARARAKKSGYNPKLLHLAKGVHKLVYDGVPFGRKGYGDFLYYTEMERRKKVPKGTAAKKQSVFVKSHSAMKGDWKNDPKSPNNLALRILW